VTPDLGTTYLGLALRSPVVASPSPMTGDLDTLRRLDAAGVGAVVLPSLFEEQLVHDQLAIDEMLETGAGTSPEAGGYFPELDDYNTGSDRYLRLLESACTALEVPVVASLNAVTAGSWVHYAHLLQNAGASALELNLYYLSADPDRTAADVESAYLDLIALVASAVDIPVAVKLGPYVTALANLAGRIEAAGAGGLVLFNRFYQPDLDLEDLDVRPRMVLSTPDDLRLPLRWIAILRPQLRCSLAATSGVHGPEDVLRVLLAGADVAMMASALLRRGPSHVAEVLTGVERWMADHEYESVEQLKGSVSHAAVADPTAYERSLYLQTILSYTGRS